jgi:hypothetical protein
MLKRFKWPSVVLGMGLLLTAAGKGHHSRDIHFPVGDSGMQVHLQHLYSWTREELVKKGQPELERLIQSLHAQRENELINKSEIYAVGLERVQELIGDTGGEGEDSHQKECPHDVDCVHEVLSIYSHRGLDEPYKIVFKGIHLPKVVFTSHWMDYSNENAVRSLEEEGFQVTFADFANYDLGGGCFNHSHLQEEQMIEQSPDLSLILSIYNPRMGKHLLHTRKVPPGMLPLEAKFASYDSINLASPLLITNLRFIQQLQGRAAKDSHLIEKALWDVHSPKIIRGVPNAPAVNIIAMAAPEIRNNEKGRAYHDALLRDVFSTALTAYSMTKAYDVQNGKKTYLNLGRWGTGAFGHNLNMVIAIQYLAARLVLNENDVVVFNGITEEDAQAGIQLVDSKVKGLFDPIKIDTILRSILNDVRNLADWNTKAPSLQ